MFSLPLAITLFGTPMINVRDHGAKGDGVTDDLPAINASIVAALAEGTGTRMRGDIVYFPPGIYQVSGPIINPTAGTSIRLVGSGMFNTEIQGTFPGFIIDQGAGGVANWGATVNCIQSIEDLYVQNHYNSTGTDFTTGAIRFNNNENGYIKSVQFHGWTGIESNDGTFETTIVNCSSSGPGGYTNGSTPTALPYVAGSVGMHVSGGVVSDCAVLGYAIDAWDPGLGNGTIWERLRTESARLGVYAQGGLWINCQTERCDTGYIMTGARGVRGLNITGTIGSANPIKSATWATGIVTMVSNCPLAIFGWTPGTTRSVQVEGTVPIGYGPPKGVWVTATAVDATTFTYPMATDPGGPYTSGGNWSFAITHGLRLANTAHGAVFESILVPNNLTTAGIDLNVGGHSGQSQATLIGCQGGTRGWAMPLPSHKGGFAYINCDQPRGSTLDAIGNVAGMKYADLPGQPNQRDYLQPLLEGDTYDIIDCNTSTFGAVAAGGGAVHTNIRYNGTAWTVAGV